MDKYRVTLLVEASDAEEAGAFVGTLGAPKHLQWDHPLHSETLSIEPLAENSEQATIDAIRDHIQRRREDPEFQASLERIREEHAHILARLADDATTDLGGPRLYFLLVCGGADEQLLVHASADPAFIARLACEDFGDEPDGSGSFDDVAVPLTYRETGVSYSIPDLSTFGIGFHSGAVPSTKILQLVLRCSEEQAHRLRALVERHQDSSRRAHDSRRELRARTFLLPQRFGQEAQDMIPVCPQCLSEEVEEVDAGETEPWRCGNCGARFEQPLRASS